MSDAVDDANDFGRRLNHLFLVRHPEGRGSYTLREVAASCRRVGVPLSPSYLSQLRRGKRRRPSAEKVAAIAAHFGVDWSYFYGKVGSGGLDTPGDDTWEMHPAIARPEVRALLPELLDLPPNQFGAVVFFVRHLKGVPEHRLEAVPT